MSRDDLEAMRKEFDVGRYDEPAHTLDDDLHHIRRADRLGVDLEEWAKARGVPLTYAKALRRFIEQS